VPTVRLHLSTHPELRADVQGRESADDGDRLVTPFDREPHDTEAGVGVLERDAAYLPLDEGLVAHRKQRAGGHRIPNRSGGPQAHDEEVTAKCHVRRTWYAVKKPVKPSPLGRPKA